MRYTMGTALNQALEENSEVSVLVDGIWLTGAVVLHDGVGVVLDNEDEHSIVKVDRITAIKVLTELPWQREVTDGDFAMTTSDGAIPMPGPRSSHGG
ncbi:MAG TPA: hypothetical protein VLI04_07390 [Nocardioidaceae bacterium]|nr:hypothetical protein [Nocardioidaceae bacterium]